MYTEETLINLYYKKSKKGTKDITVYCNKDLERLVNDAKLEYYSRFCEKIAITIRVAENVNDIIVIPSDELRIGNLKHCGESGIEYSIKDNAPILKSNPYIYWKEECLYCTKSKNCKYAVDMATFKNILSDIEKIWTGKIFGSLSFKCDYFELDEAFYIENHMEVSNGN